MIEIRQEKKNGGRSLSLKR